MGLNQLIYRMVRPLGGLQVSRYLARQHPRILMYHRISHDGKNGSIPVDLFREQIRIIKRYFNPMTMSQLIRLVDSGEKVTNAIVVTFDDGYHDFADYAFPVLLEEDVPVTIFVTTGFINGDLWLWPDQILYALEQTNRTRLSLQELPLEIDLKDPISKSWNVIANQCLIIDNNSKVNLIDSLYRSLNVEKPTTAPEQFKNLSWSDIRDMMNYGLDIGSHSYSHPILTKIEDYQVVEELKKSKNMIFDNLGCDVEGFCYPNGMKEDFDHQVKEKVAQLGYRYAVTAFPTKSPLSDYYEISRYSAGTSMDEYFKLIYGLKFASMWLR